MTVKVKIETNKRDGFFLNNPMVIDILKNLGKEMLFWANHYKNFFMYKNGENFILVAYDNRGITDERAFAAYESENPQELFNFCIEQFGMQKDYKTKLNTMYQKNKLKFLLR